ncbi:GNAT family protein [Conexibacter stalactiti]|uniref:GNAT family protein n=1 Tax=Conexibacter stalactiti TaxID=1940611 RepID=A0ABU4HUB7_9ACTN|nr:GNAT family protein [Conexibacter stalactiti]MDW5596913.1 GNAT family protein [Conexibacter stalactiti]MEC5037555.1 GNAT family protein [Conexibacter stalactiti]
MAEQSPAAAPPPALVPCDAFAPLETERLLLRVVCEDDLDAVAAYQSRADVARHLPFGPRDRAELAELLPARAARTRLREDGDAVQLSLARREDEQVIGELYVAIASVAWACVEVGWMVHPDHGGSGYATEGARALLAFVFETLHAHRAIARLDPANAASVRLCERLGMRREAHLVEEIWVKGRWQDSAIHALLAREWAARGAAQRD